MQHELPEETLLKVQGLRTVFHTRGGTVNAVRDVSFTVRRGEKVGVVGESGSGKSAMAMSLLQLITPPGQIAAGEVWLDGQELIGKSERDMQAIRGNRISLIFQDPMTSLDPIVPIGKQIAESIRKHQPHLSRSEIHDKVIALLRDVEVPTAAARVNDYPHQLSGGMRQRVMIAIALANDPDLLIADEPTTALDVTTQAQVLDVLQRLVEERGAAVLLITHNLGIVAEFCDTVKVMYAGRIVEESTTKRLFRSPVHPYTEALLSSIPDPKRRQADRLQTIQGSPPDLRHIPPGCPFAPRCPVGHTDTRCQTQTPLPITVGARNQQVVAECHYAEARWQEMVEES